MRTSNLKKIGGWLLLSIGALFLVALFVFNANDRQPSPHIKTGVWNDSMLLGAADAPNKLVEYTDYFCSFCAEFQEQTSTDRFKKEYVETKRLNYEARIITVLADKSPNTFQGAQAGFCAADQNAFWPYSEHLVPRIRQDFFDKGIGVKNVANPKTIERLPVDYFMTSATALGLNTEQFENCMEAEAHAEEIAENTRRAVALGVTGLPFIVVNNYATSGFQGNWKGLEMVLKAGGVTE